MVRCSFPLGAASNVLRTVIISRTVKLFALGMSGAGHARARSTVEKSGGNKVGALQKGPLSLAQLKSEPDMLQKL